MNSPISRGYVIGTVSKLDRKKVGDSDLTEFYLEGFGLRINAWKDLAAKVPAPGQTVMVEGRISTRQYTVDDKPRQTTEITASVVEAFDGANETAPAPAPTGAQLPPQGF